MQLEFYFDFTCPFAYLASREVEAVAARTGAKLVYRPMLLGGVLSQSGNQAALDQQPAAKVQHNANDMRRWAAVRGTELAFPSDHPVRSVRALRTLLSLDESTWPPLIAALYRAYWERGQRIDDQAVLRRALAEAEVGSVESKALAADEDPAIKQELRRRTDEALERGVFGAPTFFVSGGHIGEAGRMFFGQDRLDLVEATLRGWDPASGLSPGGQAAPLPGGPELGTAEVPPAQQTSSAAEIEFWYDFSSPFTYLAATQVARVAAAAGATLRWRPFLLGALFRELGTANVPLMTMPDAKRRHMGQDLEAFASYWGIPFRFASTFPQKSVTALRLALLAGDRVEEVSLALFRIMWADGGSLEDPATLQAALDRLGLDGRALLEGTQDPAIKSQLIANTSEAAARGVFGAPTFIVKREGAPDRLFWGQDRLGLVLRAALGVTPPVV